MEESKNIQDYYQKLLDKEEERRKKQEEDRQQEIYEEEISKDNYARWATKEEFCHDLSPLMIHSDESVEKSGVSLLNEDEIAYMDTSDSHTLIIGSSGSKKSRLVILPTILNLMKAGESMVVTDPKAELFERTSKKLKDNGYKVYCVNFRDESVMNCWNPLSIPREFYMRGKYDLAVGLISDFAAITIQEDARGGMDPFWDNMSRAAFMSMQLLMFMLAEKPEDINIRGILNLRNTLLMDSEQMKSLYKLMDPNSILASYYASFYMLPEKTYGSVMATLDTHMQKFIIRPTLTDMLCKNDVNLHELGKEKTAIFLVMPDEKETYHGMISLFIQQCYEALIYDAQQYAKKTLPIRVNFLLDEFASLPQMKEFPSMIAAARSRNIRFNIVIQSEKQLTAKYGHHGETIKGNCNNWIYLYSREWETLESLSRLCGEQKSGKALVTPSRLQRLSKDAGEALIIHGREYPFLSHLADISEYDNETWEDYCYEKFEEENVPFFDYLNMREIHSEEWIRARLNRNEQKAAEIAVEDDENVRLRLIHMKKECDDTIAALKEESENRLKKTLADEQAKWEQAQKEKEKSAIRLGNLWDKKDKYLKLASECVKEYDIHYVPIQESPLAGKEFFVEKMKEGASRKAGVAYDDGASCFGLPQGSETGRYPISLLPLLMQMNHNHVILTGKAEEKEALNRLMKNLFLAYMEGGTKIPIFVDCSKYDPSWNRYLEAIKTEKGMKALAVLGHILFNDTLPDLSDIPNALVYELVDVDEKETDQQRKQLSQIPWQKEQEEHILDMLTAFTYKEGESAPKYVILLYNLEKEGHEFAVGQLALTLMGMANVQVIACTSDTFDWERNFAFEAMNISMNAAKKEGKRVYNLIETPALYYDEEENQVLARQTPIPSVRIHLEDEE